jgi:hypothetical protein
LPSLQQRSRLTEEVSPKGARTRSALQADGYQWLSQTSSPTPSPSASSTNELDDQQQYQCADGVTEDVNGLIALPRKERIDPGPAQSLNEK